MGAYEQSCALHSVVSPIGNYLFHLCLLPLTLCTVTSPPRQKRSKDTIPFRCGLNTRKEAVDRVKRLRR